MWGPGHRPTTKPVDPNDQGTLRFVVVVTQGLYGRGTPWTRRPWVPPQTNRGKVWEDPDATGPTKGTPRETSPPGREDRPREHTQDSSGTKTSTDPSPPVSGYDRRRKLHPCRVHSRLVTTSSGVGHGSPTQRPRVAPGSLTPWGTSPSTLGLGGGHLRKSSGTVNKSLLPLLSAKRSLRTQDVPTTAGRHGFQYGTGTEGVGPYPSAGTRTGRR